MSKHMVGMDALDVVLRLAGPGEQLGEDTVPEGKVALVIETASDVAIVQGTVQQLRERVMDGLVLPIPADVPLVDVE
jgi:hypothetical protein